MLTNPVVDVDRMALVERLPGMTPPRTRSITSPSSFRNCGIDSGKSTSCLQSLDDVYRGFHQLLEEPASLG